MAECDANYIRLLKLVPQLQAYRDKSFIDVAILNNPQTSSKCIEQVQNSNEPEKLLEGLVTEFCISDRQVEKGGVKVEITIVEAFKYTTTLEIKQKPQFEKWMTNPSMLVRVYHDASTAEVISYQGHKNLKSRYEQPNSKMYHSDEKTQVNRFLGEWLTHCLQVGRSINVPDISFSV